MKIALTIFLLLCSNIAIKADDAIASMLMQRNIEVFLEKYTIESESEIVGKLESIKWYYNYESIFKEQKEYYYLFYKCYYGFFEENEGLLQYGTYSIENDNIILEHIKTHQQFSIKNNINGQNHKVFIPIINKNNFKYPINLFDKKNGFLFSYRGKVAPYNEHYKYYNIDVLKLKPINTKTIDNASIRNQPYYFADIVITIKKNRNVVVYAKTIKQDFDNGLKDSWYYVKYIDGDSIHIGWIFGGSLLK